MWGGGGAVYACVCVRACVRCLLATTLHLKDACPSIAVYSVLTTIPLNHVLLAASKFPQRLVGRARCDALT